MTSKKRKNKTRKWSRRDRRVIEHVARYRLTTIDTLLNLFFIGREPNAVAKVCKRLCNQGWLCKYPLVYPQQYYVLSKRAAQSLGLPAARALPLGPQSLPSEYAVLLYAATAPKLKRLTPQEVCRLHSWYRDDWTATPHCLCCTSQPHVLELVRIDLGGSADHVARKCYADVQLRNSEPDFLHAVGKSWFRIVIITTTTEKASAIGVALQGHIWPDGLLFHLAVVAELLPLLTRCTHA